MLDSLLSSDRPRSRLVAAILLLILVGLAVTPFVLSGSQPLGTAAKIDVFILLVASYDFLLGSTGIVSFAHTMFLRIGGYAIALDRLGPTWGAVGLGLVSALLLSAALALAIGILFVASVYAFPSGIVGRLRQA